MFGEYKRSKTTIGPYTALEHVYNAKDVKLLGRHGYITKDPGTNRLEAIIVNPKKKLRTSDFSEKTLCEQALTVSLSGLKGMCAHLEIPEDISEMLKIANVTSCNY